MPASEALTWGALVAALAGIVASVRLWMGMGATQEKANSASKSAHEAHQRIDRLTETSVTTAELAAAEKRFAEAVDGLRSDFRHMADRFDKLVTTLVSRV